MALKNTASRKAGVPLLRRAKSQAKIKRASTGRSAAAYVEPMKALGVPEIAGEEWLLEIKYDGYRALAICEDRAVELWSRNHKSLSDQFAELIEPLKKLKCSNAVLDGEVVALDPEGRPAFQLLQGRGQGGDDAPLFYYIFDLLHLNGVSLVDRPIEERKSLLEKLLKNAPAKIRFSPMFKEDPAVLLSEVKRQGLEGIVAKRRGSLYEPGRRSGSWVKKRISQDQEFVIGGFTPPRGGRLHFGALLVGYYREGKLLFAGKVGTGFDAKKLKVLRQRFKALEVKACPFQNLPMSKKPRFGLGMTASAMREVTWLRPHLVCQVKFSEWTRDGMLRQPVFLGLREDKSASEVVRE